MPGRHGIAARQAGFLTVSKEVEVVEGRTIEIELRESTGLRREIEVVDGDGNPLPFARIEPRGAKGNAEWIDEQQGTQRLDLFTDHEGRRTLARLNPQVTRLTVTWGSRKATVDLGEGEDGTLRLVLPRKDP